MIEKYCEICKEYNESDNWCLRIFDEKESIYINGHKACIDELDIRIKNIKNVHSISVQKTLKLINYTEE